MRDRAEIRSENQSVSSESPPFLHCRSVCGRIRTRSGCCVQPKPLYFKRLKGFQAKNPALARILPALDSRRLNRAGHFPGTGPSVIDRCGQQQGAT
jgi:hypothetical protein